MWDLDFFEVGPESGWKAPEEERQRWVRYGGQTTTDDAVCVLCVFGWDMWWGY